MKIMGKEDIVNKIKDSKLEFAWINTYSDLKLVQLERESNLEIYFNNLIEAKFFNEDEEISIMEAEDNIFSVYEFDNYEYKESIKEEQILNKHKSPFNGEFDKLIIKHYLDYDDEGQAYVSYTKLCNVKRGEIAHE